MVQGAGGLEVVLQQGVAHRADLGGSHVGGHADHALAASGHQGEGHVVVAAEHREAFGGAAYQLAHLVVASGSLLDSDYVGAVLGEAYSRGGLHVGAGASGHVVDHYGQRAALSHRPEIAVLALLRGLVVVGHHHEPCIGAERLQQLHVGEGAVQRVGAATGEQRHASDTLARDAQQLGLLPGAQCGGLSGGGEGHEEVYSRLDLPVHAGGVGLVVHLVVVGEGGHQCGAAALQV